MNTNTAPFAVGDKVVVTEALKHGTFAAGAQVWISTINYTETNDGQTQWVAYVKDRNGRGGFVPAKYLTK